ncbi:MAG: putative dsRNA-binding protein [Cryomorphaceae bacterium]|jgi:ribonuclease-3|nr:putative dsRNA-binding protein [Cryomorphaceae bacterium]
MLRAILRLFRTVPSEHRAVLAAVTRMTGLRPNDPNIYLAAFRRKVKADPNQRSANMRYERLEYLGDAVLGVLMAEYLYEKYPNGDEGYLTSMRSKVVSRKALNRIAEKMGIPQWMEQGRMRNGQASSVPGNTLEALVGAVYIDRGWGAARYLVHRRMLDPYVNFNQVETEVISYKSLLIEQVQKKKQRFQFDVIDEQGNDKNRFTVAFVLDDVEVATGSGQSKKNAEEAAARAACKSLKIGTAPRSRRR